MAAIKQSWQDCSKCPLAGLRTQVVFGTGNLGARLVVIGDAPSEQEDLQGTPFVGEAGERFNALLEAVGIDREDIWLTNVCACRPKLDKPGKPNRAPTVQEMKSCFPRLSEEINIVRPEIIVLLGNSPLYMATRKRGITKMRGWQPAKWNGDGFSVSQIFATLNPASLLYGSEEQRRMKANWMYEDWLQIRERLLSGKEKTVSGAED